MPDTTAAIGALLVGLSDTHRALVALIAMLVLGFSIGGWTTKAREMPAQVDLNTAAIVANSAALIALTARQDDADSDRQQILCLVRLTAEGEVLTPIQSQARCP